MRSPIRVALTLAALLLAWTAAVAQTFYISPTGVDQVGGGSASNPFRTLTFAVSQAAPSGPATFYLRPGRYDEAGGEVYPIVLPDIATVTADPAVVPAGSKQVTIGSSLALTATLRVQPAGSSSTTLRNLAMTDGMFRSIQVMVSGSRAVASMLVEDCLLAQSRCVVMLASDGARATVTVRNSRINGPDRPIIVQATGADVVLDVARTIVTGGFAAGVLLDSRLGGTIHSTFRSCRIHGQNLRGIYAVSADRGGITSVLEHCLLHSIARAVVGGGTQIGAIVDAVQPGGIPPVHVIHNSIFHQNKQDAALGAGANYTWGINLVEQPSLLGVGLNQPGAPTYIDPGNDFHLALLTVRRTSPQTPPRCHPPPGKTASAPRALAKILSLTRLGVAQK